ncbi:MAG: fdnI [Actinomycetia bacterium]|nr:fdnI [Actinomycetes bacterium]
MTTDLHVTTDAPRPGTILRFDRTERVVHWCNATLFITLMLTGAVLYIGQLSALVGRRHLVEQIHVVAGVSLPIPLLVGLVLRSGAGLRRDVGALSRWIPDDRRWLHRRTRARAQLGKFNPGQKLNATFQAAAIVVMLASGSIMYWFKFFTNDIRTGATFAHDWFAFGIWLTVIGHISFAFSDPVSLRSMVRGVVPESWAMAKRPRWYLQQTNRDTEPDTEADTKLASEPTDISR